MAHFMTPQFHLSSTQTAVAFIVPPHLQTEINSLRQIHDKSFGKWDPHINILYPFVEPARLSSALIVLRDVLHNTEKININIDEVGIFEHRRNATVILKPDFNSGQSICQLRSVLVQALGCRDRDGTYDGTFRPHIGVGQAILNGSSNKKLLDQANKLASLNWEGAKLAILKRNNAGEMRTIDELFLRGAQDDGIPDLDMGWEMCYSFSNEEWNRMTEGEIADSGPFEVAISTYNLMADSSAPSFGSRLPLIIQALQSTENTTNSKIKILCLQEINEEMFPLLLAHPFIQSTYPFSTHKPTSLFPSHRNQVTLASTPFTYFSLPFEERHKSALFTSFCKFPLEVANVHLTSGLTDNSVLSKKNQMDTVTKFFNRDNNANGKENFVVGDFNLTTSLRTVETAISWNIITRETEQLLLTIVDQNIWNDAYIATRHNDEEQYALEGEDGATFDRSSNPIAALPEPPIDKSPQRYDRLLFRKGGKTFAKHFEIFGQPDATGKCASDHYGVCASFRVKGLGGAQSSISTSSDPNPNPLSQIQIIKDSTDIISFLQPYIPTTLDKDQRKKALQLLQDTLTVGGNTQDIVIAPLGSYFMETYFADSDVDVLVIGNVAPQVFFDSSATRLRVFHDDKGEESFKGAHFVNSLVSIIEVEVIGIKFDIQYCQAPELVQRYYSATTYPELSTLVFDNTLVSSLSPSSLRPLNTYRDTAYLNTLHSLPSYRMAHRYLSLYLKRHGLYSAKFGYLGGIHLSLMLNRIVRLMFLSSPDMDISPATMIRTFFIYYAGFDWAVDNITDPTIPAHRNVSRGPRDSIFIYSIHTPAARPNVASSCTLLTGQSLTHEFSLAADHLQRGDWAWCLRDKKEAFSDFTQGFGAFVRISVDIWDIEEIGGDKIRQMVGNIESKFPRLMVSLGRLPGLDGRIWPARFRSFKDDAPTDEMRESKLKGYYMVGISGRDAMNADRKKLFTSKVITTIREFEGILQTGKEFEDGNIWISIELIPRKKILEMNLEPDNRNWSSTSLHIVNS